MNYPFLPLSLLEELHIAVSCFMQQSDISQLKHPPVFSSKGQPPVPNVDLTEWRDHRVLLKHISMNIYQPGSIKAVEQPHTVVVKMDGEDGCCRKVQDVFGSNRFDIVSDACPSVSAVSIKFLL